MADRLPEGWRTRLVGDVAPDGDYVAKLVVTAPDGRSVTLLLEAKRVIEGRHVSVLREQRVEWRRTVRSPSHAAVGP